MARVEVLEASKNSNGLPTSDGSSERNLAKAVLDMEIYASTLINDPPIRKSNVDATIERKMKEEVEPLIDIKRRTAMQTAKDGNRGEASSWYKSVIESKAMQEIGVVDAKQYRQLNKNIKMQSTKSDPTPGLFASKS